MKNKKNIYILLLVVLTVWGLVVYQFFSFSASPTPIANTASALDFKPIQLKSRDTISFNVYYRDPFLGKMYCENHVKVARKKHFVKKESLTKEPIIFPKIVYKGIVSDTHDKTKIFMLIVDGHTLLMKKGDIENEVLLKNGNKESVVVRYKGVELSIPLQA